MIVDDVDEKTLAALTAVWMNANAVEEWCWARYQASRSEWDGGERESDLWLGIAANACVTTEMAHECFLAARGQPVHGL